MPDHDHKGHRERMRERFARNGLEGFAPHEALELLLFYAIPQRNVNPLAHRLIRHFGSLEAVLRADREALLKVEGIGDYAATLLSMVLPLARTADREREARSDIITNYQEAKAYCRGLFDGRAEEVLYVVCLDAQGRVIRAVPAIRGTIDELPIYPRTVVECALRHSAYAVVLAHNHPSGVLEPSQADIQTTGTLRGALAAIDIALMDHIIYADGACISMAQWEKERRIAALRPRETQRAADTKRGTKRREGEPKIGKDDEA